MLIYYMHNKIIIVILTLIFIYSLYYNKSTINESFGFGNISCNDCGRKDRLNCSQCLNCGYCVTATGNTECTAGDYMGPYFRDDCLFWEYNSPQYLYSSKTNFHDPFFPNRINLFDF